MKPVAKMKPLLLLASLAGALVVSSSALAAGEFEGPWVGAGMGFRGTNTEVTGPAINVDGLGKDSVFGVIQGGYGFRIHTDVGDFNLGPYAFYLLGNVDSDTVTINGVNVNTRWKNQWGIGFQPGYFLTKDTVVYLKVSYNQVTLQVNAANANGQISPQDQFSGPGIGLGLKTQLASNWVIFVDTQQQYYKSNTYQVGGTAIEIKPKMTMGTFGFGYQF